MGLKLITEYAHNSATKIKDNMDISTPGLSNQDTESTIYANFASQEAYQNSMSIVNELISTLTIDVNNIHTLADDFEKYDAIMGEKNAEVSGN